MTLREIEKEEREIEVENKVRAAKEAQLEKIYEDNEEALEAAVDACHSGNIGFGWL